MKFKKEDTGLYLAAVLLFGGIGLLVGSYVYNKYKITEEPPEERVEERPLKKSRVENLPKQPVKKETPKKEKTYKMKLNEIPPEIEDEYNQLLELYKPSQMQLELLRNGHITLEELTNMLEEEYQAEDYDQDIYVDVDEGVVTAKISPDINVPAVVMGRPTLTENEKPDLSEVSIIEEEEIVEVNDRFNLSLLPPAEKEPKNLQNLYYDPSDQRVYRLTRQREPQAVDIREIFTAVEWATIEMYLLARIPEIYVDDTKTAKFYRITVTPEEAEDSSANSS